MNNYFISSYLEVKNTSRGLGIFTKLNVTTNVVIEHSPFGGWSKY